MIRSAAELAVSTNMGLCGTAICHDHAHPGLTNDFLIKTRSDTALVYNVGFVPAYLQSQSI